MSSFEQETVSWVLDNQEKAAILTQLDRLLNNPYFHHSKRYPSFLKFVVTETLSGRGENLKERTIGIEVFGREPDYDTTNDPIVRVTAAEIRKRIAQYYQEPGHDGEIRISLPSGSYLPHFAKPAPQAPPVVQAPASPLPEIKEPPKPASRPQSAAQPSTLAQRKTLIAFALVAVLVAGGLLWRILSNSPIDDFWRPFVDSQSPTLFCIADQSHVSTITLRDAADPQRQTVLNDRMVSVIIDDVTPLVDIAGMLQVRGKSYTVKGEGSTTLTDLRQGPSVMIGAFDNGWTLRVSGPLRFHFANNPEMSKFWIEDRQDPSKKWMLERSVQLETGTYKDYAIVARFTDPDTDRPVVVAAGLARGGTVAAGEFLVNPEHMRDLSFQAPKGWQNKNIEVILETQVIDGRSGPPRVVAVHVW